MREGDLLLLLSSHRPRSFPIKGQPGLEELASSPTPPPPPPLLQLKQPGSGARVIQGQARGGGGDEASALKRIGGDVSYPSPSSSSSSVPRSGQNQVEGAEPPVIFRLTKELRDSRRRENNHGLVQLRRCSFASSVFSLACCRSDAHRRTFRQDDWKKKNCILWMHHCFGDPHPCDVRFHL